MALPSLAVVVIGIAALAHCRMPQASTIVTLGERATVMQAQIAALLATAAPEQDDHLDLLPRRLSLGDVIHAVEGHARRAGVESLSVGTETQASVPVAGRSRAGPPPALPAGPAPAGAEAGPTLPTRVDPERIECQLHVRAGYQELVHLLGLLESGAPLMRIRDLAIKPDAAGVDAQIRLVAFYHSGIKGAAASPVPGK